MCLTHRPSRQTIERFLGTSQELPLSYSPIGLVRTETVRDDIDEAVVAIGSGKVDFERARGALAAWKQFEIGWVERFEVFLKPDSDEVTYRIRAVFWARATLTRIVYPITRLLQARFRRESAEAMSRATSGRGLRR
jgi:uncharacterized protein (UPF0548 family)